MELVRNGVTNWALVDSAGIEFKIFSQFCDSMVHKCSDRTRKVYARDVALFIDAFISMGGFSETLTAQEIEGRIEAYIEYLVNGSELIIERYLADTYGDKWLVDFCKENPKSPLKPNSLTNKLAALSRFFSFSEYIANRGEERASSFGFKPEQVSGVRHANRYEQLRIRQLTVFAAVVRSDMLDIRKNKRLSSIVNKGHSQTVKEEFPIDRFLDLINAANNLRDKAFWLALAVTGARTSEILNLKFSHLDIERQKIYIKNPYTERIDKRFHLKFGPSYKGRAHDGTFLLPIFKALFFKALHSYIQSSEFVALQDNFENEYIFQCIERPKRGLPLLTAQHSALVKSFQRASIRAGIPMPTRGGKYSPHSLRHMYGVYLLNYIPINAEANEYGLPLIDVCHFMGHKNLESTKVYARRDGLEAGKKLEKALNIFYLNEGEKLLNFL